MKQRQKQEVNRARKSPVMPEFDARRLKPGRTVEWMR